MNKVSWSIFGAAVALLLGGLIIYSRMNSTSVDVSAVNANSIIAGNDQNGNIADHVFDNAEEKVVFVEYGDFQCPGCGAAHPNLKTLLEEYGDKITFVFRNLPLTSIHPNARVAAASAEAAGLQGKYWEMHDRLYEAQSSWQSLDAQTRTPIFSSYARELGLDEEKFKTDLASTAVNQKISFDQALAKKVGAQATPAFFLDGEELPEDAATGILQGNLDPIKKLLDDKLDQ
jgi:protein-disulfide isomerase